MKQLFLFCFTLVLGLGCKKEQGSRVDVYLLQSFSTTLNTSTTPATVSISNPVLEQAPLIADGDIRYYTQATGTYTLKKDVQSLIQNFGPDKAFALTVDGVPVYYGRFHPAYLSSIIFGVATISNFGTAANELTISFPSIDGNSFLQQLDKRNDPRIINALRASGRLR